MNLSYDVTVLVQQWIQSVSILIGVNQRANLSPSVWLSPPVQISRLQMDSQALQSLLILLMWDSITAGELGVVSYCMLPLQ